MGLGKTRQATVAAILRRVDGLANLIVSPASMRIGWEREIKALLPGAKVWQIGEPWLEKGKPEWAVTSFEGLGAVLGQKFGVMVIDEAHYLKEMGSARTCNAFLIDAQHKRHRIALATTTRTPDVQAEQAGVVAGVAYGQVHAAPDRAGQIGHEVGGDGHGVGLRAVAARAGHIADQAVETGRIRLRGIAVRGHGCTVVVIGGVKR